MSVPPYGVKPIITDSESWLCAVGMERLERYFGSDTPSWLALQTAYERRIDVHEMLPEPYITDGVGHPYGHAEHESRQFLSRSRSTAGLRR